MKPVKPTNKIKSVYLIWIALHCVLLIWPNPNSGSFTIGGRRLYPFTMNTEEEIGYFDLSAYDLTEFIFYLAMPILIYYAIVLWKSNDK